MIAGNRTALISGWEESYLARGIETVEASCAVHAFLKSAFAEALYDLVLYKLNCGIAIAARIPMMAITIINSIRVKPFFILRPILFF